MGRYLLTVIVASAALTAANPPTGWDHSNVPDWGCDFNNFASKLSPGAEVYFPGSSEFIQYTERWSNLDPPKVNITVLPATDQDVAETVSSSFPTLIACVLM